MKNLKVKNVVPMLIKMSEQEEFNETESFLTNRSEKGLRKLLFEAIERSRLERIFNFRCGRCKMNG